MLKKINLKFNSKTLLLFLISLLILTGVYLRFNSLATHFTHYDEVFMAADILKAKSGDFKNYVLSRAYDSTRPSYDEFYMRTIRDLNDHKKLQPVLNLLLKLSPILIVSASSTNPPLQYLFIAPLINEHQSYRQILFWGRFSSFAFAVMALILIVILLKAVYPQADNYYYILTALVLLVFSWQHIIYAKQIYTYSIGVFTLLCSLLLFWQIIKGQEKALSFSGFFNVLFFYSTYQMLFIIVPFFLVSSIYFYLQKDFYKLKILGKNILIFLLLAMPGLFLLLFCFSGVGLASYNIGPHQEFLLSLNRHASFFSNVVYLIKFYLTNLFIVLQANLAFMPINKLFFPALILLIFFALGFFSYISTNDLAKRYLGYFMLAILIVWFGLIFIQKTTMAPTRISLIYLPIFILFITEGLVGALRRIFKNEKIFLLVFFSFLVFIPLMFFNYYPHLIKERQDHVQEKQLDTLVKKYNVDTIIAYNYSLNINLMRKIRNRVNYYEEDIVVPSKQQKSWSYKTILFFSTRSRFDKNVFENMRARINRDALTKGSFIYNFYNYKVIYRQEIISPIEIEFNNINKNGSNNLFITIVKRK